MFTRTFFLFACGFVLVESWFYTKRQEGGCQRLIQCSTTLETSFEQEDGNLLTYVPASDEEALNNICQTKLEQDRCIEDAREECDSETVLAEVDAITAATNYICSDKGRRAILTLATSQCGTDETKQEQVAAGIQSCLENFEFEVMMLVTGALSEHRDLQPSELCPLAESWVECTLAAARSYCGNDYANFLSDILEVSAEPRFEAFGCENAVGNKRQIARRALGLLKRVTQRKRTAEKVPPIYGK